MKIIKENIDNFEDIKVTPVVDPVTADAIEQDKKTRKVFDEYTSVNKRTFLGAEKQPVPDEPVEPDAGMKVSLDESLFEAYHSEPRYYTIKFLEMLDNGLLDANEMCEAFAKWFSEEEMQRFMATYELNDSEIDEPHHSETRYYTIKFLEMLDDGLLDATYMCEAFAKWLSEDEMQRFMDVYELIDDEVDESLLKEAKKPKYYDTTFGFNVRKDFDSGKLTLDNIEDWEIKYNGGIKPKPAFNTKEIIDYYIKKKNESLTEGRKAQPMLHVPSGEVFTDEDRSDGLDKEINHDLWSTVYDELAPGHPNVWGNTKFKDYVFSDRYTQDQVFPEDDAISVYVENEDQLEFAKKVADEFDLNYKVKNNGDWYVKNHPDRAVVMKIYIPFD